MKKLKKVRRFESDGGRWQQQGGGKHRRHSIDLIGRSEEGLHLNKKKWVFKILIYLNGTSSKLRRFSVGFKIENP